MERERRQRADIAGLLYGVLLGAAAGVRKGKAVHPGGVVYNARLIVSGVRTAPRDAAYCPSPVSTAT